MTDPRDESTAPDAADHANGRTRSAADGVWREDAHAVVIGINTYQDPKIPDLRFARADAEAIYAVLTDPEVGRFKPENVTLLLDANATERKIRSALGTNLPKRAPQESTVCIFYAGHGAPVIDTRPGRRSADGIEKYLVPHDAEADDLRSSSISMDAVQQYFSYLDANQVVCFLDCCYSGAAGGRSFQQDGFQVRALLTDEFLDGLASEGRLVVTACSANEVSLETPGVGHGVFTHRLVEGLRGAADTGGDGLVTVDELYDYVYGQVERDARLLGGCMRPIRRGSVRGRVYLTQYETANQKRVRLLSSEASTSWARGEVDDAERAWLAILALDKTHESALDGISHVAGRRAEEQAARDQAARRREEELEGKHLLLANFCERGELSNREYERALGLLDEELTTTLGELSRRRLKFLNGLLKGELSPKAYSRSMVALDREISRADDVRVKPSVSSPETIPKELQVSDAPEPRRSTDLEIPEEGESPSIKASLASGKDAEPGEAHARLHTAEHQQTELQSIRPTPSVAPQPRRRPFGQIAHWSLRWVLFGSVAVATMVLIASIWNNARNGASDLGSNPGAAADPSATIKPLDKPLDVPAAKAAVENTSKPGPASSVPDASNPLPQPPAIASSAKGAAPAIVESATVAKPSPGYGLPDRSAYSRSSFETLVGIPLNKSLTLSEKRLFTSRLSSDDWRAVQRLLQTTGIKGARVRVRITGQPEDVWAPVCQFLYWDGWSVDDVSTDRSNALDNCMANKVITPRAIAGLYEYSRLLEELSNKPFPERLRQNYSHNGVGCREDIAFHPSLPTGAQMLVETDALLVYQGESGTGKYLGAWAWDRKEGLSYWQGENILKKLQASGELQQMRSGTDLERFEDFKRNSVALIGLVSCRPLLPN